MKRKMEAILVAWRAGVGLKRGAVRQILAYMSVLFAVHALPGTTTATTIGLPVLTGNVSASSLAEISGIVDSRSNPNTFWVHNDSGDAPRFYAISHSGGLLGTFPLAGAPLGDWEDIAIGPKPGGGNYLYLGDIGDNDLLRPSITVYRTTEPQTTTGSTIPMSGYATANLTYPNGPRNAESLFVDPITNDLFIITKDVSKSEIYSAPASAFANPGQTTVLTALGTLGVPLNRTTAADISPDGRFILARSSKSIIGYLFTRGIGQSVADALHGPGKPFTLGAESQGEAIGWAADGKSFYTTSESDGLPSAPIHSYAFTVPEPNTLRLTAMLLLSLVFVRWNRPSRSRTDSDFHKTLRGNGQFLTLPCSNLPTYERVCSPVRLWALLSGHH